MHLLGKCGGDRAHYTPLAMSVAATTDPGTRSPIEGLSARGVEWHRHKERESGQREQGGALMGLLDRMRGEPKVGGQISYFGLTDWWLSTFTEVERKYIRARVVEDTLTVPLGEGATSESPSGEDSLTQGDISWSSKSAAQLLYELATWFQKPQDRRIARLMLAKAEELAEATGNVLDLHFTYLGMIKTFYRVRDTDPAALDAAISACEKQIALAPDAAKAWRSEYSWGLPAHTGFTQLAIIREKQKDYDEAIRLSKEAMSQGWFGDWENRIARCEKRLAKQRPGGNDRRRLRHSPAP